MRLKWIVAVTIVLAIVALPALANDRKHGVGLGFSVGSLEPDGDADIDTKSFTIFGKGGFKGNWSINGTLHIGEEDEDFLFGIDLTQLNVGVAYNFLQDNVFRPFVQAGLGNVDLEGGGVSEDDTGLMVGAGAEIGSPKWAFYGGVDYTMVEIGVQDVDVMNWTAGGIFKF